MTLRQIALNTFAGWLAGTLCSLGGALKDSPVEGFKANTFPRSMAIATFWGLASSALTADFFLAFAFAGYFERLSVEGWKIIRAKRPSKFVDSDHVMEWGRRQCLPGRVSAGYDAAAHSSRSWSGVSSDLGR